GLGEICLLALVLSRGAKQNSDATSRGFAAWRRVRSGRLSGGLDGDLLRLRFGSLRQRDGEDAELELGGDLLGVDLGRELEGALVDVARVSLRLLAFGLVFGLALDTQRNGVARHLDVDLLLVEAGKLALQHPGVGALFEGHARREILRALEG